MRLGRKNGLAPRWARTGTRPRQLRALGYRSAYLFGAICPARGAGAAVVMPKANTEAMQHRIDEIERIVRPGAHAMLLLDGAARHTANALKWPRNIAPLLLPPRRPNSTRWRTSGNICARRGYPTASSTPVTTFPTPPALPGTA